MGGCGGIGAKGGGGGGTSVGLLSWNSAVTLSLSLVASGSGGAGGNGGKGGAAGAGVKGGTGGGADTDKNIERGGDGGRGGNGGNGGSGAGGSGGPSFAIVFSGIKPSYDLADTTLKPGLGGAKGTGGGAAATKAPDGSVGASDDFLEL